MEVFSLSKKIKKYVFGNDRYSSRLLILLTINFFFGNRQNTLLFCYRSGSTAGGTPQRSWVRSPSGANFSSGVKKTPSLVPRPKHCGARPNSQGDGPPCTGGAGVRGFFWPAVRRSFYLSNNAVGAVSPPAGQVFFRMKRGIWFSNKRRS